MWIGGEQDQAITRELRFAAIELGDSQVLGELVRLDVSLGTTVLVGKNGAGKSAVLERIYTGLRNALGFVDTRQADPGRLACELVWGEKRLHYECVWKSQGTIGLEDPPVISLSVEETCIVAGEETPLWRLRDGINYRSGGTTAAGSPERSVLFYVLVHRHSFAPMSIPMANQLSSVRRIPPGAHQEANRSELIVPRRGTRTPGRLAQILYRIAEWSERSEELFTELVALGQRTGVWKELHVKVYRDPEVSGTPKDLVSLSIDNIDLGLLSDGTLRALELLCALIEPSIKLILIDEPESAVHPGLLGKLLHEIEAYSSDRQIVLATHSPQVVSWAKPEAIRVVTRTDGATHVRSLGEKTIKHLEKYLHDEDTLGEFVYGGGLDGLEE